MNQIKGESVYSVLAVHMPGVSRLPLGSQTLTSSQPPLSDTADGAGYYSQSKRFIKSDIASMLYEHVVRHSSTTSSTPYAQFSVLITNTSTSRALRGQTP